MGIITGSRMSVCEHEGYAWAMCERGHDTYCECICFVSFQTNLHIRQHWHIAVGNSTILSLKSKKFGLGSSQPNFLRFAGRRPGFL